jgi:3-isopropylmalate/(R)-2-methylmalate dehydratase large subunit
MGMTITEKILARHAGRDHVQPGESIWCNVDVLMTHDVCGPGTIGIFKANFGPDAKVWDPDKVVLMPDHYIFTADTKAHRNVEILRDFAREQGLKHHYDADFVTADLEGMPIPYEDPRATPYGGVCHAALPEKGHTRPGEILLGTDSHTCTAGALGLIATGVGNTDAGFVMGTGKLWLKVPETRKFVFHGQRKPYVTAKDFILHVIGDITTEGGNYRALEFAGEAIMSLNIDERCTMTNMAIEAGGKNGIIAADDLTCDYVRARTDKPFEVVDSDPDAAYMTFTEYDAGQIEPTVALPHSPDNRALARELGDVAVDRAYLGSCTGGQLTDFIGFARIIKGKTVKVETFCVPGSTEIDAQLDTTMIDGTPIRKVLLDAGCLVAPSSCAACLGGPVDTFGRANEPITVISATNRNFPGRMGHKQARVHLASPLTVAASALTGKVTDPREFIDYDQPLGQRE